MKRPQLLPLIALAGLIIAGLAAYFLLIRKAPSPGPGPKPGPTPSPSVAAAKDAVLDLYLAGPASASGNVDRIELTMIKATARRGGREEAVTDAPVRLVLRAGAVEKMLSDALPDGAYDRLTLTFASNVRIVTSDGASAYGYMPAPDVQIALKDARLPAGRTLVVLARMPIEGTLGTAAGVPTFGVRDALASDSTVLGGIFQDPRQRGNLLTIPDVTLASVIKTDIGLDITPHPEQTGSSGFTPAVGAPGTQPPAPPK